MTFGESVSTCISKYVKFDGRATRSEYWWFCLFCFLVSFAVSFVFTLIGMEGVSNLVSLVLFLPSLAVAVRRCHDSGKSGWWVLCPIYNLILMFVDSDHYVNEYGEEPLN